MDNSTALLSAPLFVIANYPVTGLDLVLASGILAVLIVLILTIILIRGRRNQAEELERARIEAEQRAAQSEIRMAEILKTQSEMHGRMATMADLFGARQSELNQTINQRLDSMTSRIGSTMTEQTKSTQENLSKLQERLAVIDTAQNNIQALAKDVVGLQAILSNKQTRGAFGQSRMEAIIADGLPMGSYEFQATLTNGKRPDCVIKMPNDAPSLVIDAKFPLEAWNAIRAAESPDAAKAATQQFRRDIDVHLRDVSEKYLINGETQDTAFMFVPSESIFAEIHENFEVVVQNAHKLRIVIVSPSLLMLSIQVIQALLKDARMREQAHLIQGEVIRLMEDLGRLDDRVRKLNDHFGQTQKDIGLILTSTEKLTKRGAKIGALEFEQPKAAPDKADQTEAQSSRSVESRSGQLKLRVIDEE